MSTAPYQRFVPSQHAWLWLCAGLILASLALWLTPLAWQAGLHWRAQSWMAQPWMLWTASLVHINAGHLVANVLALAAVAALGVLLHMPARAALALALAWPLATLGLVWWPAIGDFCGISGLIHAAIAVVIAQTAIKSIANTGFWLLLTGLLAKLWSEHAWSQPWAMDTDAGFAVVTAAHLTGALAGAGTVVLLEALRALCRVWPRAWR